MSLDGGLVSQLAHEIITGGINSRVEKIAQPTRDEIIIHLRGKDGNKKLLINATASNARVHFTQNLPENPQSPPMFCMLLRKHLQSARLTEVRQQELDRILFLIFEGYNELGDKSKYTIVVEIMGRYSNIILLGNENQIIDAFKKVDFSLSAVRQILPGIPYTLPPEQDKINIVDSDAPTIIAKLKENSGERLSKGLIGTLQGFSPLPTREISYLVSGGLDKSFGELTPDQLVELETQLNSVANNLKNHTSVPTMILEKDGRPKDFSFMPINQYEGFMDTQTFDSYGEMLDFFYTRRDTIERMRQRSGTLLKLLENTTNRISRRLSAQMDELEECKNREELKIKGDLLTSNIYQLKRGDAKAEVINYYDSNQKVEIALDIRKTPAQNAQHYYIQYRKADTAEKKLTVLIEAGLQEQVYIDSVLDSLKRSETEEDLEIIKSELISSGYLKRISQKKKLKPEKQTPFKFVSSEGFTILAGRNNLQNDRLSLKESHSEDMWLHTQRIPGSHVIIVSEGKEIPERTLEEAAVIAAYHSKARNGVKVAVDYTPVKYVKKASGAKPGMVIYDNFKTITIDPSEKIVDELEIKK